MIRTELRVIIPLVLIIAWDAIFLVLDVEKGTAFWTSICFLTFSYVMLAVSFIAVPRGRAAAILNMALVLVASIYFALEFLLATVFIYAQWVPLSVVIVTQIILATIFIVVFFMTMSSNDLIAARLEEQHADVMVIKSAVARLTILSRNVQEPHIAKCIYRLEEEFRYSPTARPRTLYSTDREINVQLGRLEMLVAEKAPHEDILGQIAAISGALASRNSDIKLQQ